MRVRGRVTAVESEIEQADGRAVGVMLSVSFNWKSERGGERAANVAVDLSEARDYYVGRHVELSITPIPERKPKPVALRRRRKDRHK